MLQERHSYKEEDGQCDGTGLDTADWGECTSEIRVIELRLEVSEIMLG